MPERVAGVLWIASVAPDGLPDLELTAGMGEDNIQEFGLARKGEAALRPLLERRRSGCGRSMPAGWWRRWGRCCRASTGPC